MRWWIVDVRRRNAALVAAAIAAAALLGWTLWSGLAAERTRTLRPIRCGDGADRRVALTFDVGRGAAQVEAVLAELKACGAPATFFVTASWAKDHGDLVRRMVADGHSVETCGPEYTDLSRLGRDQAAAELRQAAAAIEALCGARPQFFRPPGGRYADALLEAAISDGLIPVTWSIDAQDWRLGTASAIAKRIAAAARPGAIILLHAGDEFACTAAALRDAVAGLRQAELEPVTLRALLAEEGGD